MLWFLHPDGMRAKVVLLAEALVMALRLERHYRPLTLSEWMGVLGSHVTLPMLERLMRRAVELMRDRISKDLAAWRRQLVEARLEHDQVRRAEQESVGGFVPATYEEAASHQRATLTELEQCEEAVQQLAIARAEAGEQHEFPIECSRNRDNFTVALRRSGQMQQLGQFQTAEQV